jgi:hypothetical protein
MKVRTANAQDLDALVSLNAIAQSCPINGNRLTSAEGRLRTSTRPRLSSDLGGKADLRYEPELIEKGSAFWKLTKVSLGP